MSIIPIRNSNRFQLIMSAKLMKTSKPVKTPVSWLQSGKLSGNENARDVQAASHLFSVVQCHLGDSNPLESIKIPTENH